MYILVMLTIYIYPLVFIRTEFFTYSDKIDFYPLGSMLTTN